MPVSKLIHFSKLKDLTFSQRSKGLKIVFTNGCFDLLHPGHIDYLAKARALGDLLIVGLNSDASIKKLKGEERPINNIDDRVQMLGALSSVDYISIFEEDTPIFLIEEISPDFLVKGGDYTIESIVGAEFVKRKGGKVTIIPFKNGYSTSNLIDKIKSLK